MNQLEDDEELEIEEDDFTSLGTPELTDETISQEQINELKMLGMDKPKKVSWERWQRIQDIRSEHEHMIHLAASGMPQKMIAQQMGYEQASVSKILNHPEVKIKVRAKIDEIYGGNFKKAIQDRNHKAMAVVDEVLEVGKETEKASMAKWVLEQTVGKASQEIKETKTSLTQFIIKVEEMEQAAQLRNVGPDTKLLSKPKDHFDTIIEEMIPKGQVFGKRSSDGGETE